MSTKRYETTDKQRKIIDTSPESPLGGDLYLVKEGDN